MKSYSYLRKKTIRQCNYSTHIVKWLDIKTKDFVSVVTAIIYSYVYQSDKDHYVKLVNRLKTRGIATYLRLLMFKRIGWVGSEKYD